MTLSEQLRRAAASIQGDGAVLIDKATLLKAADLLDGYHQNALDWHDLEARLTRLEARQLFDSECASKAVN